MATFQPVAGPTGRRPTQSRLPGRSPNTPTPERMGKGDYEDDPPLTSRKTAKRRHPDRKPARRRRAVTLKALYDARRIGDEEIRAAARWLALWEMGMNGYSEGPLSGPRAAGGFLAPNSLSPQDMIHETMAADDPTEEENAYLPGDTATFRFTQARALSQIGAFRRQNGLEAHRLLILLLAHALSFTVIGARLYPDLSAEHRRRKASTACAEVLEDLAVFWRFKKRHDKPTRLS